MGCGTSAVASAEVIHSKNLKTKAIYAIAIGTEWRQCWLEFTDAMEQAQMAAAHWAADEPNESFVDCFKTLSIQSTELYILSKAFILALEIYLSILTDILSLQRDLHSSLKTLDKAKRELSDFRNLKKSISRKVSPFADEDPAFVWAPVDNVSPAKGTRTAKFKDPLYICQTQVDELTQLASSKRERLEWAKRERIPAAIHALMIATSDMWTSLKNIFDSMDSIIDRFSYQSMEQDKPADIDKQDGLRQNSLIGIALNLNREQEILKRRNLNVHRWISLTVDCAELWERHHELQINHLRAILDWWIGVPPATDYNGMEHRMSLVHQSTSIYYRIVRVWLEALLTQNGGSMANERLQLRRLSSAANGGASKLPSMTIRIGVTNIRTALRAMIPILQQIDAKEQNIEKYHMDIDKLGREAAKLARLNDRMTDDPSKATVTKSLNLALAKLEAGTTRLEKAHSENRQFRKKVLIDAERNLWFTLAHASKQMLDSYFELGNYIISILPANSLYRANTKSSILTPLNDRKIMQSPELHPVESSGDDLAKSDNQPGRKRTSIDQDSSFFPSSDEGSGSKPLIGMQRERRASKPLSISTKTHISLHHENGLDLSMSMPSIFASTTRMSFDVPKFVVDGPADEQSDGSEIHSIIAHEAVFPLMPSKTEREMNIQPNVPIHPLTTTKNTSSAPNIRSNHQPIRAKTIGTETVIEEPNPPDQAIKPSKSAHTFSQVTGKNPNRKMGEIRTDSPVRKESPPLVKEESPSQSEVYDDSLVSPTSSTRPNLPDPRKSSLSASPVTPKKGPRLSLDSKVPHVPSKPSPLASPGNSFADLEVDSSSNENSEESLGPKSGFGISAPILHGVPSHESPMLRGVPSHDSVGTDHNGSGSLHQGFPTPPRSDSSKPSFALQQILSNMSMENQESNEPVVSRPDDSRKKPLKHSHSGQNDSSGSLSRSINRTNPLKMVSSTNMEKSSDSNHSLSQSGNLPRSIVQVARSESDHTPSDRQAQILGRARAKVL